jgi:hypothetical protein
MYIVSIDLFRRQSGMSNLLDVFLTKLKLLYFKQSQIATGFVETSTISSNQGFQMVCFQTKNPNLGKF